MKSDGEKTGKPSTLRSLRKWIALLAETFPKKALSPEQVEGYAIPLEEFSLHELDLGFRRTLREWKWVDMPPPAFIRQQVAAELEVERLNRPVPVPDIPKRLTLDEAWEDWLEMERTMHEGREKYDAAMKDSAEKAQELAVKRVQKVLVTATPDRVAELKKQAEEIERKYGKGAAIRVRNPASPETNEGPGGTGGGTEERVGTETDSGSRGDEGRSVDPGKPRDPG